MEENKTDMIEEINSEVKEQTENEQIMGKSKNSKKSKFISNLGRSLIDTIVIASISYVIFMVVQLIMNGAGYQVVAAYKFVFFFIVYIVVSVFYKSICSLLNDSRTVGEKFFK